MISLLNYEKYVLDFLEVNLPLQEQAFFLQFITENPSIGEEIQGLLAPKYKLQASETIVFEEKRFLKKGFLPIIKNDRKFLFFPYFLLFICLLFLGIAYYKWFFAAPPLSLPAVAVQEVIHFSETAPVIEPISKKSTPKKKKEKIATTVEEFQKTPEIAMVEKEILPVLEEKPKVDLGSEESTFDFSQEKKVGKSLLKLLKFSVEKIKQK